MWFPLVLLSLGSLFRGYRTKDIIIGLGTSFWGSAIFVYPHRTTEFEAEFVDVFAKLLPVVCGLVGGLSSLLVYHWFKKGLVS